MHVEREMFAGAQGQTVDTRRGRSIGRCEFELPVVLGGLTGRATG